MWTFILTAGGIPYAVQSGSALLITSATLFSISFLFSIVGMVGIARNNYTLSSIFINFFTFIETLFIAALTVYSSVTTIHVQSVETQKICNERKEEFLSSHPADAAIIKAVNCKNLADDTIRVGYGIMSIFIIGFFIHVSSVQLTSSLLVLLDLLRDRVKCIFENVAQRPETYSNAFLKGQTNKHQS